MRGKVLAALATVRSHSLRHIASYQATKKFTDTPFSLATHPALPTTTQGLVTTLQSRLNNISLNSEYPPSRTLSTLSQVSTQAASDVTVVNKASDYIGDQFEKKQGVVLAESHGDMHVKELMIELMPKLKAQGLKVLYLEVVTVQAQHLIDDYYKDEKADKPLRAFFDAFLEYSPGSTKIFFEVIKAAKENGIKVIGIDSAQLLDKAPEEACFFLHSQKHQLQYNHTVNDVVLYERNQFWRNIILRYNTTLGEGGKYVVFCGSGHTTETNNFRTNSKNLSIQNLLGVPAIRFKTGELGVQYTHHELNLSTFTLPESKSQKHILSFLTNDNHHKDLVAQVKDLNQLLKFPPQWQQPDANQEIWILPFPNRVEKPRKFAKNIVQLVNRDRALLGLPKIDVHLKVRKVKGKYHLEASTNFKEFLLDVWVFGEVLNKVDGYLDGVTKAKQVKQVKPLMFSDGLNTEGMEQSKENSALEMSNPVKTTSLGHS